MLSLLLNIDEKKGSGPDRIPNAFLKHYAEPVCKYLFLIFSKSLKYCQVPSKWESAKILPIHKSGDSSCPSNYRPISIACTSCKILEHIILKSLTEYVEENAVLHSNQHGFRRGLSTVTQLVGILHNLASGDQSQVFLDLSKALDRVFHPKLQCLEL